MKALLNVKIDQETKVAAQKLAREMGLSLSAVVNGNLKHFVNERHIYFEAPLVPNKKTRRLLDAAEKDIKAGRNIVGPFDTAEEMLRSLNS